MAPPRLPPHLSHKSALVLLPTSGITLPIQAIRRHHDRNYQRWPPHINLIYPFLSKPSTQIDEITARTRKALAGLAPFDVELCEVKHFEHSHKSCTVYLATSDADVEIAKQIRSVAESNNKHSGHAKITDLQRSLQAAFSECNADTRQFSPHLSLGQAKGPTAAKAMETEAASVMEDFCRSRSDEQQTVEAREEEKLRWRLHLPVDKVAVLERAGYDDPFRVVAEIPFEEGTSQYELLRAS